YETYPTPEGARSYQARLTPEFGPDGTVLSVLCTCRDLTEHRRAEDALRKYRAALDAAADMVVITDRHGRVEYVNPAFTRQTGYAPEEVRGRHMLDVIAVDGEAAILEMAEAIRSGGVWQGELRGRRKDGSEYWEEVRVAPVRDPGGGVSRLVAVRHDITDRKVLLEELTRQAFYDALTRLPNRALFMDRLEHALAVRRGPDHQIAILFLDLDRFKVINDSLGHAVGDQLLVAVGERLRSFVRGGDTVARLGGDEFIVLLEEIRTEREATLIARRIIQGLRRPFDLAGREARVTPSIGIVLGTPGSDVPGELLRDADIALYQAKAQGRSRYVVFDTSMRQRVSQRLDLEIGLQRAIERGELAIHYQPIVGLSDGAISSIEALVRWRHPERGLLTPKDFVSVAEETGLIVPIGRWVLEESCRQLRAWHEAHPSDRRQRVTVNLSARQLQQPDLIDWIAGTLARVGLDPDCLKLEITESVVMEDVAATAEILAELRGLGVRIAIDDFGTGYSSLSYLTRLPADTLKIDRSFVRSLGEDERNLAVVRAVTSLAHSLGMEVTAEGIETSEQIARLREIGCDRGQGYYFSRPLPAPAMARLLSGRRKRGRRSRRLTA
ncbi:MAG: EAL domain-containing protein, partial [Thermomicrobiaceae bacterium]|nr:EAL domain-containing protein [Thermomicrobiaceae bacterium]